MLLLVLRLICRCTVCFTSGSFHVFATSTYSYHSNSGKQMKVGAPRFAETFDWRLPMLATLHKKTQIILYGAFLTWWDPRYHPFIDGISPYKSSILGYPHCRKPPDCMAEYDRPIQLSISCRQNHQKGRHEAMASASFPCGTLTSQSIAIDHTTAPQKLRARQLMTRSYQCKASELTNHQHKTT